MMSSASSTCPSLEKRKLDYVDNTGKNSTYSALDAAWVEDMDFLPYCPPHCVLESYSEANVDPVWVEAMSWLNQDLQQLLQMSHHKFWCQVIHDTSLQQCLDSYLQHGPRPFDPVLALPADVRDLVKGVHRRMFAVLLRLSTHKENSENYLSPDFFAETVYSNHLVDLPKLLDLCAIYGGDNKELVSKMVDNLFRRQPRLGEDWRAMVGSVLAELTAMSDRVTSRDKEMLRRGRNIRFSADEFADVVIHFADFAATLRGFVTVYPPCVSELMRARFTEKTVEFYEAVVPRLRDNWHVVKGSIRKKLYVKERLRNLKSDLAWLVHECLCVWYLAPPPLDSSGVRSKVAMDGFVATMSEMASEPNFLKEYERHFDVIEEVRSVQRDHPEMPEDQFEYLLSALEGHGVASPRQPTTVVHVSPENIKEENISDKMMVESLVSKVKDLLPHLGAGFIKVCLKEFGNDPETVINKVLENSLPPHLQMLDFSMAEDSPPQSSNAKDGGSIALNRTNSLVDKRENVYDGDEFDVFRRPDKVELSRVHVGKKFDTSTVASVLDDKSHLQQTREQYAGYRMETEYEDQPFDLDMDRDCGDIISCIPGIDIMYEDEYDDTYDSQNVGAADDATDEQFVVKRLNTKGLFGRKLYEASGDEEEKVPTQNLPTHPVILKRPDHPHRNEQLKTLQSVKGFMSEISQQTVAKEISGRGHGTHSGGLKDGQEWKRKGDKASWRARHKEEEGGVVEVKHKGEKGDRPNWRAREKEDRELRGSDGRVGKKRGEDQRYLDSGSKATGREAKNPDTESLGRREVKTYDKFQKHGGNDDSFAPTLKKWHQDDDYHKPSKETPNKGDAYHYSKGRPSAATSENPSGSSQLSEPSPREAASATGRGGRHPTADKRGEKSGDSGSSQKQSDMRARQVKDRHKASRANHNRKNMADKKKRGGMI